MFLSSIHGGARRWKLSGLGLGFGGTVKNGLLISYVLLLQCASLRICLVAAVCSCCHGCVSCFPCLLTSFVSISFLWNVLLFFGLLGFPFWWCFLFLGLGCRGVQVRGGVMAEEAIGCAAFSPPCEMLGVQAAAWYCAYHAPDSTW
jgi:hypothetical protein